MLYGWLCYDLTINTPWNNDSNHQSISHVNSIPARYSIHTSMKESIMTQSDDHWYTLWSPEMRAKVACSVQCCCTWLRLQLWSLKCMIGIGVEWMFECAYLWVWGAAWEGHNLWFTKYWDMLQLHNQQHYSFLKVFQHVWIC